jgi:hypothetical protein
MGDRSDTFNRADSTSSLGTPSDGGSAWSVLNGTWGISSNRGYCHGAEAQAVAVLESSAANVEVQVTIKADAADDGLILRASDNNNYILGVIGSSGTRIFTREAGSFTLKQTDATAPAINDVFKLTGSGNTVTLYKNGASVLTDTITFNNTATKHGIRASLTDTQRFEDFSITDLDSATASPLTPPPCQGVGLGGRFGVMES